MIAIRIEGLLNLQKAFPCGLAVDPGALASLIVPILKFKTNQIIRNKAIFQKFQHFSGPKNPFF